jgi:hypothetical protein
MTRGIRDELCSPTTFGIEHDRLRNNQMQFKTALRDAAISQKALQFSKSTIRRDSLCLSPAD